MTKIFIINPAAIRANLQDAIDERITKIKSITASLLLADETCLDYQTMYGTIWAIDGLLDEVDALYQRLEHPINIHR